MTNNIRNRIISHRRLRAGDLVPHEFNFRAHPESQAAALRALYQQVGFARSLLAYELPDGRLKLIDGHLRRDLDPDMIVDVEVLDLTDDEARTLLLSIDPLASLAESQAQLHHRLLELAPPVPDDLQAAWQAAAEAALAVSAHCARRGSLDPAASPWPGVGRGAAAGRGFPDPARAGRGSPDPALLPDQYLILITCRDEMHQTELLARLQTEGVNCKALLS